LKIIIDSFDESNDFSIGVDSFDRCSIFSIIDRVSLPFFRVGKGKMLCDLSYEKKRSEKITIDLVFSGDFDQVLEI